MTRLLITIPNHPMEGVEWIKPGAMGLPKTDQRDLQTGTTGELVTDGRMARHCIWEAALKLLVNGVLISYLWHVSILISFCLWVCLQAIMTR